MEHKCINKCTIQRYNIRIYCYLSLAAFEIDILVTKSSWDLPVYMTKFGTLHRLNKNVTNIMSSHMSTI